MSSVLADGYDRATFLDFATAFLPPVARDIRPVAAVSSGFSNVMSLGRSSDIDLEIFEVKVSGSLDKRVAIASEAFKLMKNTASYRSLVAFHSDDTDQWRLSLLTAKPTLDEGKVVTRFSSPKRFSYLLGPGSKLVTPSKQLLAKGRVADFDDLSQRFAVEVVNNEFYREIARLYDELVGTDLIQGMLKYPAEKDSKHEFGVRLVGRIIFCWFLREKRSNNGAALIPSQVLSREAANESGYYHATLAPLFFEVLNKRLNIREERFQNAAFATIPYLNGGLFSPDTDDYYRFDKVLQRSDAEQVDIPDHWLHKLLDLLEMYNFTVDENTSFDIDLSIDPEMLGRIFENLLARINPETGETVRRGTGSFYTPREIVEYMVDQSLGNYLAQATSLSKERVSSLMDYDLASDEQLTFSDAEKQAVLKALSVVKILDPACGSGAFPIGILQKIVFILQRADPDAKQWLQKQIIGAGPELRRHLEEEFSNKNFDYLRKLGVIRESIYGVDIQPVATEISRLRCFLTLVVDQSVKDDAPNRGIEPLPNLDFKFVTANSLVKLGGSKNNSRDQVGLFEDMAGINELKELRNEYFSSHNSERESLKLQFSQSQNGMLQRMISNRSHGYADLTQRVSSWNPFSHHATHWFDPEWMFGIADGFDIVIGNPPYVSALKSVKDNAENRDLYRSDYKELSGAFDLYAVFLLRGLQLLKRDGVYSWIVPNKLSVASYAKGTYNLLLNTGLISSVSVSMAKVFEASVYPVVILGTNHGSPLEFNEYSAQSLSELDGPLDAESDALIDSKRYRLIRDTGIKMSSGATGFQAQMIKEYLSESPGVNRIPFTVSGCIDPYRLVDKPVRYMGSKYAKAYIEKIGTSIAESKWRLWEQEKIVIAGMTKRIEAVLVSKPLALGVGTYAIYDFGGFDKYALLGILNSSFLSYYLTNKFKAKHLAGGYLAINKMTIEQLPLPSRDVPTAMVSDISRHAKMILEEASSSEEAEDSKTKIDQLVYGIFNLTPQEISTVEEWARS